MQMSMLDLLGAANLMQKISIFAAYNIFEVMNPFRITAS